MLLLAHGGFVVRNLLLGTFAERVMLERPLLAAVTDPHDPELVRRFAGRPIRFLAERLGDFGHSLIGEKAAWLLEKTGFLLRRLRLLGALETWYLKRARGWPITQTWRQILEREWPSVVVSSLFTLGQKFRPSVDLPPLVAAHELGIPVGFWVPSWDELGTQMGVLPVWLDRYWTWSPHMNGELGALYPHLSRERFHIVGSPQFDFHRRPELLRDRRRHAEAVGLDPSRRYLLIATGTPETLPDEHLKVAELIRRLAAAVPDVQVLLRLHPKDPGDRWDSLATELAEFGTVLRRAQSDPDANLVVSLFEFCRAHVNDLFHAEAVVNGSSTLTVEAALLDKPVVCLAFAAGSHSAPLVATGGITLADNPEAALAAVLAYLADPALHRQGRQAIVDLVTATPNGGAGERLAIEALALAERAF